MRMFLVIVFALLGANSGVAQSEQPQVSGGHFVVGARDTVRTNLWLFEALMHEVAEVVVDKLPATSTTVGIIEETQSDQSAMFLNILYTALKKDGRESFLPRESDSGGNPQTVVETEYEQNGNTFAVRNSEPELELAYKVTNVKLEYPDDERRFAIWRQWVSRHVSVSILVTVIDNDTGRILVRETITRSYRDQILDEHFRAVDSDQYSFTSSETPEGNWWNRRLEQFVVLSTLTGLVAVYFSNTN